MISPEQYEELTRTAASKFGKDPKELQTALGRDQLNKLLSNLSEKDAARIQSILADKQATNHILSSPQARMLLQQLLKGNKR